MSKSRFLTAKEATEALGVSAATLYAYVSRGLIRSESVAGDSRSRRYHAEDIERLKERQALKRNPAKAAQDALNWGQPVLESSLTLITTDKVHYRGVNALALAQTQSIEAAAALLWTGHLEDADRLFASPPDHSAIKNALAGLQRTLLLSAMQCLEIALALAGDSDLAAYDLRPESVAQTGARILWLMANVLATPLTSQAMPLQDADQDLGLRLSPGSPSPAFWERGTGGEVNPSRLVALLQSGWNLPDPDAAFLLNAALILSADHELNVSSFTARVVASGEAQPYRVVAAGLSALQGFRHGGNTQRVEGLFREAGDASRARQVIADRLRRGERIPGFGHKLYPEGDPRGRFLLDQLAARYGDSPVVALAAALEETTWQAVGQRPNIDLGLTALALTLGLPQDGALSLFALGRAAGWIAHAMEQYAGGQMIRPRASYVGEPPHVAGD
jgi:citrate synthase